MNSDGAATLPLHTGSGERLLHDACAGPSRSVEVGGIFLVETGEDTAGGALGGAQLGAATPRRPARLPASRKRAALPARPEPQLCTLVETAPEGADWITEIKFDGYRIMAVLDHGRVRLVTRNGLDWAERMPSLAAAFGALDVGTAVLDGELVAMKTDGASSFPALQAALKAGRDVDLVWFGFDLLYLEGRDWRPASLLERKAALLALGPWTGMLRYSDHVRGQAAAMYGRACGLGLEGIVCKRAGAAYKAGRGRDWLKVKCMGREEFIVIGFTPPAGSRAGLGALQLGYFDPAGRLHYAGAVGSGFTRQGLSELRKQLDALLSSEPDMLVSGEPVDPSSLWVRPELVAEVQFTAWSGAGRLRHPVYLGLREEKVPADVVREPANPEAERTSFVRLPGRKRRGGHAAVPPVPAAEPATMATSSRVVVARKPKTARSTVGHVELSHPERELWPGITKQDLAVYWQTISEHAVPGLASRPLSILRCPGGIAEEQFFQKNGHGYLPPQIREGMAGKQPYLAIDDADGLFAMAQMSAIELHAWGAPESDPLKPDTLVFDLDPGEGVPFGRVMEAAFEVRERLRGLKLESLCRTTGGKGLHVIVPLRPDAGWDVVKPFCRAFAETMARDTPDKYVARLKIADRSGKILIDWLRNGLGATAIGSFSPRARPGAGVATPLAWSEVGPELDPAAFTIRSVPQRLAEQANDPWADRPRMQQRLPRNAATSLPEAPNLPAAAEGVPRSRSRIVTACKPKPRT